MWHIYNQIMRFVEHMHMHQWLLVFLGAAAIGILCMRGFGSRRQC